MTRRFVVGCMELKDGVRALSKETPRRNRTALRERLFASTTALAVLMVAFTITISVLVYVYRGFIEKLGHFGYLGAFALPLIGNVLVTAPFPWPIVIGAMGPSYNHIWLTGAA